MNTMIRSMIGGAIGTTAMTLMMYFVAPRMTGRTMDIAAELGAMIGGSWALGMAAHFLTGVVIFPAAYVLVLMSRLPGSGAVRGAILGTLLWIFAQAAVMPMIGAGFFSSSIGVKSAVASLIGHLIYGIPVGVAASSGRRGGR